MSYADTRRQISEWPLSDEVNKIRSYIISDEPADRTGDLGAPRLDGTGLASFSCVPWLPTDDLFPALSMLSEYSQEQVRLLNSLCSANLVFGRAFSDAEHLTHLLPETADTMLPNSPDATDFKNKLNSIMSDERYVSGESSPSEIFVETVMKQRGADWVMCRLREFYREKYSSEHVLIGLLHMLSHYDYDTVAPAGPIIALGLLQHPSEDVSEFAVKAFENWNRKETLPALRSVKFEEDWLQEYVDQVIEDIEAS